MPILEIFQTPRRYFRIIYSPVVHVRTRRHLMLRTMITRHYKAAVSTIVICFGFVTFLYFWYLYTAAYHSDGLDLSLQLNEGSDLSVPIDQFMGTPMRHIKLNEVYQDLIATNNTDEMLDSWETNRVGKLQLDTEGCKIPLEFLNFPKYSRVKKSRGSPTCEERAIFLKKVDGDKVAVFIKTSILKKYIKDNGPFVCCYRFLQHSPRLGKGKSKLLITPCKVFENSDTILLETDFINIKCYEQDRNNNSREVYDDVFAFTKKLNFTKKLPPLCNKYNVLMLGMDSMSLQRVMFTMPRTVKIFLENSWITYKGYHKVGDNTFPNLMAALTGKSITTIYSHCANKMDSCNELLIWSQFKQLGYATAYGEDHLRLPDTFHDEYAFHQPPTDHYLRPLFLKGEREINNGSLVCSGKKPSGQQLLDYALDFALTYRDENFFGVFWMNSFSHNINSRPQDADRIFENFFNQLSYTGVLENTFLIFFSDHGIRFGEPRLDVASYYDDRLPSFFIRPPFRFRAENYHNSALALNQFNLVTPYDLYNTLAELKYMSVCRSFPGGVADGCPKCQSLFKSVPYNRTCRDIGIAEKWCSCHNLYPVDKEDHEGTKSVDFVVSHIQTIIQSIETKHCWGCMSLYLQQILRIHFYYDETKTNLYHVVAFTMSPGTESYEATVSVHGKSKKLIGPVSSISPYRGLGKCTLKKKDRLFCVCYKHAKCKDTMTDSRVGKT